MNFFKYESKFTKKKKKESKSKKKKKNLGRGGGGIPFSIFIRKSA